MLEVRRATPCDLQALADLEAACYDPARRQSRASLRRALRSPRQVVWVQEDSAGLVAAAILWLHPRTVRIYGVHVRPDQQGRGLGRALVLRAEELAAATGRNRMVLEADADDVRLLDWYGRQGYARRDLRGDFYAPGRHAWRFEKRLGQSV